MNRETFNKLQLEVAINEVKNLTASNHHTKVIGVIADYISIKSNRNSEFNGLRKACESLETLHNYYQEITQPLKQMRDDIKNRCFALLTSDEQVKFNRVM